MILTKILGLDLGTNSIGWAIVDDDKKQILEAGVRIFPEGIEPKTLGTGDKEQSKNATRREARQSRRQNFRTRIRRIKLLEKLIEQKMCPLTKEELLQWKHYDAKKGKAGCIFPSSNEFTEWLKLNPYVLRSKALNEDISLMDLGRIFYHLIQRRGFLSSRKGKDDGKIFKGKDNIEGIDKTKEQIKNSTLGSFLNTIYPEENKPFINIIDENGNELRIRSRYTLRDMYISEFDKIWGKQADQLGLSNQVKKIENTQQLKGSIESKRNKHKIKYLISKYGEKNVKVENNIITTTYEMPLKEYFGGKITYENGELKHKSQNSLIFYQRPLRSQKGLLSKCSLEGRKLFSYEKNMMIEVGPTPAPLSHPEYEEFRAWQFINNIEYGNKQKLDDTQRNAVINLINTKDASFKFKLIPDELGLSHETFNYENKFDVIGNYTHAKLKPLFLDSWGKNKNEIWHCFYFYEDNDKLIKKIEKNYNKEIDITKIEKIKLKDGYANVSLKAIRNITPFLIKRYYYSDAVILGGVRNAFRTVIDGQSVDRWDNFKNDHKIIEDDIISIVKQKENKEGEVIEKIKTYLSNFYGFEKDDKSFKRLYHHSQGTEEKELIDKLPEIDNLRNPIVQQGLNELRRLVNTLIDKYKKENSDFRFDQIKVELGRNLRSSKNQRQEISNRISDNRDKNDMARQRLNEYGLRHSRDNIQKYLLFKEIEDKNGEVVCPYTGITISIKDLLGSENKVQIEHIIPRSISLDDSFANKTLCDAKFNGLKGNKTPFQFYWENNDTQLWRAKSWDEIEQRTFRLLPYAKAKRFTSRKKDWDKSEFIQRQLNDTRYISKKAKEILSQICDKDNVRIMPGSLTSELRHLWGLNNVLQPVKIIDTPGIIVDEDNPKPHWVVLGKNKTVNSIHPVYNEKPAISRNETTISGKISENIFTSKYFKLKIETSDMADGEYWATIKLSDKPQKLIKVFTDKPVSTENEIVLRGSIEKSNFINDTIGKKVKTNLENGKYWAKFEVLSKKFEIPVKDKKPKKKTNQILLYGNVKSGIFNSYIYECKTNVDDGKYWILLDIDFGKSKFIPTMNKRPELTEQNIIIYGTINNKGAFSSEIDYEHTFIAENNSGKYWAEFEILEKPQTFYPLKNKEPEILDEQTLIEGNIWVDKYTGEIKFDPKKNREDHRHHAIDAITIALTEQSYLQKLSTYNANKDEKKRGNPHNKPVFDVPWEGFFNDVQYTAENILISHKKNNPVLTEISKIIYKNGKKYKSKGYAARGSLHKEFVFGKRTPPAKDEAYHIRKSLESLKTEKQINKIVDDKIREIVHKAKIEEKEINKKIENLQKSLKSANNDYEEQSIKGDIEILQNNIKMLYTLPNKRGERVPIKKVRIRENISNAAKLKSVNQFVNPRNNHHVVIYKDSNGDLQEHIVTFWEAVKRKLQKQPLYQLPPPEKEKPEPVEIIETLEQNDMFLLGLTNNDFDNNKNNFSYLSQHLYKVEAISSKYYEFRHHLESTQNREYEPYYYILSSLGKGKKGWQNFNPIKVKISPTGKIMKI